MSVDLSGLEQEVDRTCDLIDELRRENKRLRRALRTIMAGMTTQFTGAPRGGLELEKYGNEMWEWSQKVARAALEPPS